MHRIYFLHPFLLGLYPILFLYSNNFSEVPASQLFLPITGVTCLIVIITGIFTFILKNRSKAALLMSLTLIMFFFFGHAYQLLKAFNIGQPFLGNQWVLFGIWCALLVFGSWLIVVFQRFHSHLTSFLNTFALLLIIFASVNLNSHIQNSKPIISDQLQNKPSFNGNIKMHPDIYYIILDAYASSDTLYNAYNFDNSDFYNFLSNKGFHVIENGRSNYAITDLSLASSLNMEYLDELSDIAKKDRTQPFKIIFEKIQYNQVASFLKSQGYKCIHIRSGIGATDQGSYADQVINPGFGDTFLFSLLKTTLLLPFEEEIVGYFSRNRIINTFPEIEKISKTSDPKFIFAHILSPHPPYLFDSNGGKVSKAQTDLHGLIWKDKERYIAQLQYINKRVSHLVESILENSQTPPVIILQSDHGSASSFNEINFEDIHHVTDNMLQERMTILNAYYLPGVDKRTIYNDITPVNSFRMVLNSYFNTQYNMLNDEVLYSSYADRYNFLNATSRLNQLR